MSRKRITINLVTLKNSFYDSLIIYDSNSPPTVKGIFPQSDDRHETFPIVECVCIEKSM